MTERRCPTCDKPADPGFRPFCSARCADVDLHRWLSGRYVVPAAAIGGDEAEESTPDAGDPGGFDEA